MRPPYPIAVSGGLSDRMGQGSPRGTLLRARNCRYLPGDQFRLRSLLGRAVFNSNESPTQSVPTPDIFDVKWAWAMNFDRAAGFLALHRGGSIFEAALAATGEYTEAKAIALAGQRTPSGTAIAYGNRWYYIAGNLDGVAWDPTRSGWARYQGASWRRAGHQKPLDAFLAGPYLPPGAGLGTRLPVSYLYRIYDANFDLESQHSDVVVFTPPNELFGTQLVWPTGVTLRSDIGTHMRIYRTLADAEPSIFYRTDGNDSGIPLATVVPGFTFNDTTTNAVSQDNGIVEADGEEGTLSWAEHGGPVPNGNGAVMFRNHNVVWDVVGEEDKIFYSAQGFPESFPVDFEGRYAYFIPFQTRRSDAVQICTLSGSHLTVFLKYGVFRILELPTFGDPVFDRLAYEPITDGHGVVGKRAACSFGVGRDQAQRTFYFSRSHGLMITDGVYARPVRTDFDFLGKMEKSLLHLTQFIDYTTHQEVWVSFVPRGGTQISQAFVLDYSMITFRGGDPRITGPVDVRPDAMAYGPGDDGEDRLYVVGGDSKTFVQDSGGIDAQRNTNAAGDIVVDIETADVSIGGSQRPVYVGRLFVEASSGVQRQLDVTHFAQDGVEEYQENDKAQAGPGETSDACYVGLYGQSHRFRLQYQGPVGSSYLRDDADEALALRNLEVEFEGGAGKQTRTSNT